MVDENTISAIRNGFGGFETLNKTDQAIFHMKIGAIVNHWFLARQLGSKGLIDARIPKKFNGLVIAILSTPGGLEYWEHDAQASPDGIELLAQVRENQGELPSWIEMMPWWGPD